MATVGSSKNTSSGSRRSPGRSGPAGPHPLTAGWSDGTGARRCRHARRSCRSPRAGGRGVARVASASLTFTPGGGRYPSQSEAWPRPALGHRVVRCRAEHFDGPLVGAQPVRGGGTSFFDLPAPFGPSSASVSPRRHREVEMVERECFPYRRTTPLNRQGGLGSWAGAPAATAWSGRLAERSAKGCRARMVFDRAP